VAAGVASALIALAFLRPKKVIADKGVYKILYSDFKKAV